MFFAISALLLTLLLIDGNIIKSFARFKLFAEKVKDNFNKEKEELTDLKDLKQSEKSGKKPAADAKPEQL